MSGTWRSRLRVIAPLAAAAIPAALAVGPAVSAAPGAPVLRAAAPVAGPAAVPGELVVRFRSSVGGSQRAAARSDAQVQIRHNLLTPGAQLVKVDKGQTVDDAIAELEKRSDVRYAEPNWIYQATATLPDDPLLGNLWGLNNTGQAVNGHAVGAADDDIDAPEAWDRNQGSGTVVGVVDSGVDWMHPDIAPNIWSNPGEVADNGVDDDGNGKTDDVRGWDFWDGDNNPWDYTDHGTHVAGTIAARGDNGIGVAGVAWKASIMPIRALNESGSGTSADIADGFTYGADNGAKVVNASLGGPFSQLISNAITGHPNTLYVVSAGNGGADGVGDDNETTPQYPCNLTADNVICVAATDNNDSLAGFSNFGATSVDLAAPGVDVQSARPHYTVAFSDDFESGLGNWTIESGPWTTRNVLGRNWLVDSFGNYAPNADVSIRTTSKVDVGSATDCVLTLTYGTFLEQGFDWFYAQSSPDGTTWTTLAQLGNTQGAVRSATLRLGAAGSRYYRFRLTSNATNERDGAYVDTMRVACPGGTYGPADYKYLDGTSMASPHVAGAAAVLFSAKPSATVADVKAALLSSGDPVAALSTKTVSGRRLNLDSALTALVPDPTPTTGAATGVGTRAATLTGSVNPNGTETEYQFEYWTGTDAPTKVPATPSSAGSGSSAVPVTQPISGLVPATTYSFRIVAYRGATAYPGSTAQFTTPPDLVISEVRGGGNSANDDYVELFNRGPAAVNVAGYRVAAANADGSAAGAATLPAQSIPPRGTLLVTASTYSLGGLAGPDDAFTGGAVPADGSVALFDQANALVDEVLFTGGLGTFAAGGQYAFVRQADRSGSGDAYGLPTATRDFALVVPEGSTSSAGSALPSIEGVPAPQNLASPAVANGALQVALLDPTAPKNAAPNRETIDPDGAGSKPQTLYLRRTVTNTSGASLSRVQFRVTTITTARSDRQTGQAIVRLDSSDNASVAGETITPVALERTTETPLPHGGGLNAAVTVPSITPAAPLAPGASINVEFALRIELPGAFQVVLNTEAVHGS